MRGGFLGMADQYAARKRAGRGEPGSFSRLCDEFDSLLNDNRFTRWLDHRFFDWTEGKQTKFQGFITLSMLAIVGLSPLLVFALLFVLVFRYL